MLKALIVDDEPFIRKGILKKVDWEELGVETPEEADDAVAALEYIQNNHVDIILTDIKMPEMDGIQFIEQVKRNYGDRHRFIIISGYGEFEFARSAIKFGVTDYLLKPINGHELEETIRKVVLDVLSESKKENYRRFLESSYADSRDLRKDKLLSRLIVKNGAQMFATENVEPYRVVFPNSYYLVAALKIDSIEYKDNGFCDGDEDLILFAVRNILEEIFEPCPSITIFTNIRNARECIILYNSKDMESKNIIKRLAAEAIHSIHIHLGIKSTVGIGEFCSKINDIHESYAQATFAIRERILNGSLKIYDIEDVQNPCPGPEWLNDEYKNLYLSCLQNGKKEDIVRIIDNLFSRKSNDKFFYNHSSVYELCLEFYIFLSKYFKQNNKNISEFLGDRYEFVDTMMEMKSLDEISSWIKRVSLIAADCVLKDRKLTGEEIVQDVKAYIDRNYAENITLNSIAQKYFIHPNYFCRIFRSIVGDSFTGYIARVRVEKSKEILLDSTLRFNQICELVGYDDPRYFSQVFKKYVGLSPSEYQANMIKTGV